MLSLINIEDIYQCEDTDPVYAIVRSPRSTHVVRVGDLVPAGTILVISGLKFMLFCNVVRQEWLVFSGWAYTWTRLKTECKCKLTLYKERAGSALLPETYRLWFVKEAYQTFLSLETS